MLFKTLLDLKDFSKLTITSTIPNYKNNNNKAFQNTFKRIWDLSEYLHMLYRKFYTLNIHLTVNKMIK